VAGLIVRHRRYSNERIRRHMRLQRPRPLRHWVLAVLLKLWSELIPTNLVIYNFTLAFEAAEKIIGLGKKRKSPALLEFRRVAGESEFQSSRLSLPCADWEPTPRQNLLLLAESESGFKTEIPAGVHMRSAAP
jgi:hypothetical protein